MLGSEHDLHPLKYLVYKATRAAPGTNFNVAAYLTLLQKRHLLVKYGRLV